jgi:hypothetical protein
MKDRRYRVESIPRVRRLTLDTARLARGRHIVHGLIEVDVTRPREEMRAHEARTGEKLSFTAYVVKCLGQAIESNPHLHAYRSWRNRLVIYDDVQIVTMIEVEKDGRPVPVPLLVEAVNDKSVREIQEEIRAAQRDPSGMPGAGSMSWFIRLPGPLRRLFYWLVMRTPQLFRAYSSSVIVTAVGMFGRGGGWAIPMPSLTLTVSIGGVVRKPGVVEGRIEVREFLDLTLSFDHDIVDGAPAARFTQQLRELLEGGHGGESSAGGPSTRAWPRATE